MTGPDKRIIARYLDALQEEISDAVELHPFWSFNDGCRLELKAERQNRNK